MHNIRFSPEEISTLRAHGVVLFADRVIFDAQPPMQAQPVPPPRPYMNDDDD